jgi:hypothetical protein
MDTDKTRDRPAPVSSFFRIGRGLALAPTAAGWAWAGLLLARASGRTPSREQLQRAVVPKVAKP